MGPFNILNILRFLLLRTELTTLFMVSSSAGKKMKYAKKSAIVNIKLMMN